jgi:hypothetical protein
VASTDQISFYELEIVLGTARALLPVAHTGGFVMSLAIWLPAMVGLGLSAVGLMALFVRFCDRV